MLQLREYFAKFSLRKFGLVVRTIVLAIGLLGRVELSIAQQEGQKTFPSPEEASSALFTAIQKNDLPVHLEILGPAGKDIISSGDTVEDQRGRERFVRKYQEMHRLAPGADGTTVLYIGAENWPFPIPLVNRGGAWFYDTEAGRQEILFRRIGRNELTAIRVCSELAEAQKEYFAQSHDGDPVNQFAQKFKSDKGKHNGLYWKPAPGTPESPIGPLLANAEKKGYPKTRRAVLMPFEGYYYRILTGQGGNAPGGMKSYISEGKMIGGFAILAYPAEYRVSGVMSFVVGQDGVVYQKDLGPDTETLAKALSEYDPDSSWQKAE